MQPLKRKDKLATLYEQNDEISDLPVSKRSILLQEESGLGLKSQSSDSDLSLAFDDISAIAGSTGHEKRKVKKMSKNHGAVDLNSLIFL